LLLVQQRYAQWEKSQKNNLTIDVDFQCSILQFYDMQNIS